MDTVLIRSAVLVFFFLLAGLPVRAQAEQSYAICATLNLVPSLPEGMPSGAVSPVSFGSSRSRSSTGALTFHNLFGRKIAALELLVDYLDENGVPQAQIPYVATTTKAQKVFEGKLHTDVIKELKRDIPGGGTVWIIGESFTLLRICPLKANLTFFHILYEDGETAQWEAKDWKRDPFIRDIPLTVKLSCGSKSAGFDISLRITVSAEGRVLAVDSLASEWPCLDELKKAFADWAFYPALQNGSPSLSGFHILLRFNRVERRKSAIYALIAPQEIKGPTVVVDFFRPASDPTEWIVFYGPKPFGIFPPFSADRHPVALLPALSQVLVNAVIGKVKSWHSELSPLTFQG